MRQKRKNKLRRIVLTGGHGATTALSVSQELIRRSSEKDKWDIYWIGVRHAVEGKTVPTLESEVFPKIGVSQHAIIAGRIQRKFTLWTIPSMVKIPFGFFHSFALLKKIKPDAIISFGGFAAFPVVVVGYFLRIPIVIHEQTSTAGLANKFTAPFATKIALARADSLIHFPKEKSQVIGNPVLTQIAEISVKEKLGKPPTIYVTGGSRGSRSLNSLIEEIVNELLSDFIVIHQTGHIDYEKFKKIKASLSEKIKQKYEVYARIDPMQVDGVFKRADIIIARAGANTVADVIVSKRPAIFIPLPFSYLNEQLKNAELAKEFGIARVLLQEGLTGKKLLSEIQRLHNNWNEIVKRVKDKESPDIEAASKLVDLVEGIVK